MSEKMPTPEELAQIQEAQGADSGLDDKGLPKMEESLAPLDVEAIQNAQAAESALDEKGMPKVEGGKEGLIEEIAKTEQEILSGSKELMSKLKKGEENPDNDFWKNLDIASLKSNYEKIAVKLDIYGFSATCAALVGFGSKSMYNLIELDSIIQNGQIYERYEQAKTAYQNVGGDLETGFMAAAAVLGSLGIARVYNYAKFRIQKSQIERK